MNDHSLRILEFRRIVEQLKDQAACELGRWAVSGIHPASDIESAQRRQKETSEAKSIFQNEGRIPLDGIRDIRPYIEKARLEAMLQPLELLDVCRTLSSARRLRSFLTKLSEHYPLMSSIGGRIITF
ncbi:MAG: endonuclease MutS2, partial [Armatimonadota bacterium]|nr:endonuclease MutS2 [Armatimonadota bacterium]